MAILRKENVILREDDTGKIEELKFQGYEEIKEEDLKPKKAAEETGKSREGIKPFSLFYERGHDDALHHTGLLQECL
nr:hypothetical protein [Bacillus licheniformis]